MCIFIMPPTSIHIRHLFHLFPNVARIQRADVDIKTHCPELPFGHGRAILGFELGRALGICPPSTTHLTNPSPPTPTPTPQLLAFLSLLDNSCTLECVFLSKEISSSLDQD